MSKTQILEDRLKKHALQMTGLFLTSSEKKGLFWKTKLHTDIVYQFEQAVKQNTGIPGELGRRLGEKEAMSLYKDEVATILADKKLRRKAEIASEKMQDDIYREVKESGNNNNEAESSVVDYETGKMFINALFNEKYLPIVKDYVKTLSESGYPSSGNDGMMGLTTIDVIMMFVIRLVWETNKTSNKPDKISAGYMINLGGMMARNNALLLGMKNPKSRFAYSKDIFDDGTKIFNYLSNYDYGGDKDKYDLLSVEILVRLLHYVGELKDGDNQFDYLAVIKATKKFNTDKVAKAIKKAANEFEKVFSDRSVLESYKNFCKYDTSK
ncbi:MAG: hypothetical protein Q4C24_00485 [Candidatus Saccharibacteria bacterium]|nr:hypothetical protein [Candidatus Saccharibacteria bacterium]